MADQTTPAAAASPVAAQAALRSMAVLRIALGALFVSVFFDNLSKGLYSPGGYAGLINDFARNPKSAAPGFWRDGVMPFVAANSSVLAPLQAITEAGLAIALVVGLLTGIAALAAAGLLTSLWVSELGLFWVWELLVPMAVAAAVALATFPQLREPGRSLRERVLGPPLFARLGTPAALAAAVGWGVALGVVSVVARTGATRDASKVAIASGAAFAVLLAVRALLDRGRGMR